MSADFLAGIPSNIVDHAKVCMTSPDTAISGAYLTGTVMGNAEGKQTVYEALDTDAISRAESLAADLGARPQYPWEQPHWDRRRLQSKQRESPTGYWQPKTSPGVDRSGPWPTVVPPTHEPVPLAVAA